jgi:hypothetical protein
MWKQQNRPSEIEDTDGVWDDTADTWIPLSPHLDSPPASVRAAPRLPQDLASLQQLFSNPIPPSRCIRASQVTTCLYGFVDASGSGFGSSFQLSDGAVMYRYGLWGRDADDTSSNYKELRNLVESLEEGVATGALSDSEIFVFTDNSTAEGAYYRGNSDSKLLFDLVLRLRHLAMNGSIILHIVHVAGTRMIHQGTDGLSRGDFSMGVLSGTEMSSLVPLHLTAVERAPPLVQWLRIWIPDSDITPLSPADWFEGEGHGLQGGAYNHEGMWLPLESTSEWFLWTPPPAAAATALSELGVSRHKRPHLNHVFVCPRLLTQMWRKKLHKIADLVIEIPAGCRSFWPKYTHEPLLIGLTLRFSSFYPWQLRQSDSLLDMARQLREVWKDPSTDERVILRQLCALPGLLGPGS